MSENLFAERLLQKAKSEKYLTASDRAFAVEALKIRTDATDAHALLRALSISGPPTPDLIEIAEEMWRSDCEDWWSQASIYALCKDWNFPEDYIEWLLDEITIENWQTRPSSGIAALSTIGTILSERPNNYLLSNLLLVLDSICEAERLGSDKFWATHLSSLWSAIEQAVHGVEAIWNGQRVTSCGQIPSSTLAKARALAEEKET